ncbi:MAG TPA: hypothetical protein VMJ10_15700 [Kofleriaceae bacterium]|nr:hypothetical protein [Kofleriaceae bacterium]
MRGLVVVAVAACGGSSQSSGPACTQDSDCGGDVCAANGLCESSGSVRNVRIAWTVSGQTASSTTCASIPNLDLYFIPSDGDTSQAFGYAPVPCAEGVFTELKLPNIFTEVQMLDDVSQALLADGIIDASNALSVDLAP